MGGLTFEKLFIVLVIALFVVGPDKLPGYAKKLGELVRSVKKMADGAKDRLRDEMGPEFDDVDWMQLDERQYDPRPIIRDALIEDEREAHAEARKARAIEAAQARRRRQGLSTADPAAVATAAAATATATVGADAVALTDDDVDSSVVVGLNFDDQAT